MPSGASVVCPNCNRQTNGYSELCNSCGAPLVGETSHASSSERQWIIGSDPAECQIQVDQATVSRRHCVLRRRESRFFLQDLNSSNKTYVNGEKIYGEVEVSRGDKITLGKTVDFGPYWPREARVQPRLTTALPLQDLQDLTTALPRQDRKVLTVGRGPHNNIVLNRPRVSWTQAELIFEKGQWTLRDAQSAHGTAVGSPSNRITSCPVTLDDLVFFGEFELEKAWSVKKLLAGVEGKRLEELKLEKDRTLVGRGADCDIVLDHPSVSRHHAELVRRGTRIYVHDLGSLNGTYLDGKAVTRQTEAPASGVVTIGIFTLAISSLGTIEKAEYNRDFVVSVEQLAVQIRGKRLIEDVSFTFLPTEVIAVMGGSGAGKTTLLKALCGYTRPAAGRILYNGRDLYTHYGQFRHLIGYVPQDDIMHPELKVKEALLFAVMLRTGQNRESAMKDVDNVLRKLDLWDVRDSIIGSPMNKVISGGQRKRVNIAMELLCRPSCLFLDEPTSGLSSQDAKMVIGLLRTLAQDGKTVVMTIHQPSRDIFEMFSALVVVKRDTSDRQWIPGRRIYFGPAYPDSLEFFNPEKVREHLESGGHPEPELLFEHLESRTAQDWERHYIASKYKAKYVDERHDKELETGPAAAAPRRRSLWQIWLLVRRNLIVKLRDPLQSMLFLLQPLLFAALVAVLFHGIGGKKLADFDAFLNFKTSVATVHFLFAIAAVWFGCNNAAREIVSELSIYLRERMACLATRNYLLSKLIFLAALCFLQCLVMLTIIYLACQLKGPFLFYLGMGWLTSLVGVSVGLAISALAALKKAPEAAVAALPLILLPMILLGGGVYPLHKLDEAKLAGVSASKLLSPLAPTRWMFEADLLAEATKQGAQLKVPQHPCERIEEMKSIDPKAWQTKELSESCSQQLSESGVGNRGDVAGDYFPLLKPPGRSTLTVSLSWLIGLFASFLALTILLLRRLEKKEIG